MVQIDSKEIMAEFATANLTDPRGRLSSNTESFSGDGSTQKFNLDSSTKAVTEVTIDGTTQKKWEDYIVVIRNTPRIEFYNAPANSTDIEIDTKTGTGWIYPDLPRDDLSEDSFPRLGITNRPESGNRQGTHEADIEYFTNFFIFGYALENKTFDIGGVSYEGERLVNKLLADFLIAITNNVDEVYPRSNDVESVKKRGLSAV